MSAPGLFSKMLEWAPATDYWQILLPATFASLAVAFSARFLLSFWHFQKRRALQTAALAAVFLVFRIHGAVAESFLNLAAPLAGLLLLKNLPLRDGRIYRCAIGAVIVLVPVFAYYFYTGLEWRGFVFGLQLFLFITAGTNFLLAAEAIHGGVIAQDWHSLIRVTVISFAGIGPLPVHEALSSDLSPRVAFSGGIWIISGLAVFVVQMLTWNMHFEPIAAFANGHYVLCLELAIARWAMVMAGVMAWFAISCGSARLLGIPVTYPVRQPWLATDFADYWKRANLARYHLFRKVFWDPFGPAFSKWGLAARVMVIFFLSSVFNIPHGFSFQHFLRWQIEGAMTVASLVVLRLVKQKRIRAYIEAGRPPPPTAFPVLWSLRLFVIIIHGFLFALEGR